MKSLLHYLVVIGLLYFVSSCKKDKFFTDSSAALGFSTDTVMFDTVFTQLGSATQVLQVYNPYDKKLKISSIRLAGGPLSKFRVNIDGVSSWEQKDIELLPKDSLWIFVQVTIDPLNSNSPLVVKDSLVFETNGNIQDIDLIAWGQDAVYFHATDRRPGLPPYSIIPCNGANIARWRNDKPIVIFDYAVVDSGCKLIIDAGTKIHFYTKTSGLWVYQHASIKVNGTKDEPVIFQGGRLEADYREIPGQWDRIWINEGAESSVFNYAVIKNGYIGIQAEVFQDGTLTNTLELNNTFIRNMTGWGILSRVYNINAVNTIVSNCSKNVLALTFGGQYNFTHCTFANYWSNDRRKSPLVFMNNHTSGQQINFNANFNNCILHGDLDHEFEVDFASGADSSYKFTNCLLKVDETKMSTDNTSFFINVLKNVSPGFKDASNNDFHLESSSPCINTGTRDFTGITNTDYENTIRDAAPDIGAFEYY